TGKAVRTLRGHVQNITYLGVAPDGRTISTLDNTGEFKEWNTAPEQPVVLRGLPSASPGSSRLTSAVTRLSADGRYIVGVHVEDKDLPTNPSQLNADIDSTALGLWDVNAGRILHKLPLRPMPERPKAANQRNTGMWNDAPQFSTDSRFVFLVRFRS